MLVRVGIDSGKEKGGDWNAPCSTDGRFCFVPIPERRPVRRSLITDYSEFQPFVEALGVKWPEWLRGKCHRDPDFAHLTYGDERKKASRISKEIERGDFLFFYAGLRSVETKEIVCSIIGRLKVEDIQPARAIPESKRSCNAHTRRCSPNGDIVVFGDLKESGRVLEHIPIGRATYTNGANVPRVKENGKTEKKVQRLERNLLLVWGQDGDLGIQRSAGLPILQNSKRFLKWFDSCKPTLVSANNV